MSTAKSRGEVLYEKRRKRREIRVLHAAVKENNLEEVKRLLKPDVDVNFQYGGVTALQLAVTDGLIEMCTLLIENGADVNHNTVSHNTEGGTLLNVAVWNGHADIVRLLVKHGAELDITNNIGASPLNTAAYRGHTAIAKMLIDADCDLNRATEYQRTPLITCSKFGFADVAKALVDAGCDRERDDRDRNTALISATQEGHLDVVRVLVKAGVNVDAREKYGRTALYFSAKKGDIEIVKELVNAGAGLDITDTKHVTPFLEAVLGQHDGVIKVLIAAGCDVNIAESELKHGGIHAAVRQACQYFGEDQKNLSIVKMLLDVQNCNLDAVDRCGWTPLCQSVFGGEEEITRMLLAKKVQVDVATESGDTSLHLAVFGNKPNVFKMLLDAGCNVNAINKRSELPLYTAIEHRAKLEILKLLVSHGSELDSQDRSYHQTPLFAATQQQYTEAVKLLLDSGASVNIPNMDGDTALYIACEKGNDDITDALLSEPDIDVNAGIRHKPLHAAASHGYIGIVEKLIRAGADVNQMTEKCETALFMATEANSVPVTKLLIKYGANPSQQSTIRKGRCCKTHSDPHPHLELEPMFNAVKNDNFLLVKYILLATPCMPYRILKDLRDLLFHTGYIREARMSERLVIQYAEFFTAILSKPRTLQEECRGIIRLSVGSNPHEKINKLRLPTKLRDYCLLQSVLKS